MSYLQVWAKAALVRAVGEISLILESLVFFAKGEGFELGKLAPSSRPLHCAEIVDKGGRSASARLELEAEKARLSP